MVIVAVKAILQLMRNRKGIGIGGGYNNANSGSTNANQVTTKGMINDVVNKGQSRKVRQLSKNTIT